MGNETLERIRKKSGCLIDSDGSFEFLSRFYLSSSAVPPIPSPSERRNLTQAPHNHLPVGYQSSSGPRYEQFYF